MQKVAGPLANRCWVSITATWGPNADSHDSPVWLSRVQDSPIGEELTLLLPFNHAFPSVIGDEPVAPIALLCSEEHVLKPRALGWRNNSRKQLGKQRDVLRRDLWPSASLHVSGPRGPPPGRATPVDRLRRKPGVTQ
eukprot:3733043-Alexandrium_andersonii.AAC.1